MKAVNAASTDRDFAAAHHVCPFQSPVEGVLVSFEQSVDQPAAFVRPRRIEELGGFLRSRRNTDRVEVNAAEKRRVAGQFRRGDLQLSQLVEHEVIDVIPRLQRPEFKARPVPHVRQLRTDDLAQVPHENC